jgi:putative ABC transport system permease protein
MYRSVPVRLVHGHRFRQMAITGLEREATLRRLVDGDGRIYPIPPGGVVLTTTLGAALDIERGDTVRVELLERGGAERRVVVTALLDELLGIAGYMEIGELNQLVGEGPVVSGAYLALEPGGEARALAVLRRLPGVAGATPRRAMLESFEEQITSMITLTTTIVALLACVIAVGVLYNGARIALSERGRDLASLRVIGFTKREVAGMLLGEQGAVNLAGTPLGLLLGLGLAWLIAFAFKSELYRFPVIVTARTYLWGVVMVIVAGAAAGIAMRRRLNALDLIEVLKTRE